MSSTAIRATPHPQADRDHRVLVLVPFEPDSAVIGRVLEENGLEFHICADLEELLRCIDAGAAAAVVGAEALEGEARPRFIGTLKKQPEWSDFPLVVLIPHGKPHDEGWRAAEGLGGLTQLSLLDRPLHVATMVIAVRGALQSRRRQYQVRDELAARQKAEQALRKTAERLRAVNELVRRQFLEIEAFYDSAPVGLCVFDSDARFVRINDLGAEINGLPAADHIGRSLHEVVPDLADQAAAQLSKVLETTQPVLNVEIVGMTPAQPGVERTWLGHWWPLMDDDGNVVAVSVAYEEITRRKRAERALVELNETLEHQVAERTAVAEKRARALQRMAAELSNIEERERERISKILHDDLQQLLVAARLQLGGLARTDASKQEQDVAKVDELLQLCIKASRDLTAQLSPSILHRGSLRGIFEWLADWFDENHGLEVAIRVPDEIPALPETTRKFLYRSVRELLFNAFKHSGTSEARVETVLHDRSIAVWVEDGGSGFDPQALETRLEQPESFGLFSIRERAEALSGRLEIRATAKGGARFGVILPLESSDAGTEQDARVCPDTQPPDNTESLTPI